MLHREIERTEADLSQYAHCKNIVFKMAQMTKNPAIGTKENPLSQSGVIDENDPAFHLPTLEEFLNVLTELKEHNLSLMQNTAKMNHGLKKLTRKIQKTSPKVNDKVSLQILDLRNRLDTEKTSAVKLKKKVCLHESLKTGDEGIMLNALGEKVSKKYIQCVDKRPHLLSTLEMVANMESRLCTLLDQLDRIPEDFLEGVLKIKETERSSRQREELLRHEREKQKEKLKKCMQRSCGDSKKRLGRKLMPRCLPIKNNSKQEKETKVCEENEAFLFPAEDDE
uniref:Uncharacterized protein n=1 Tax=Neogobius melanostomus TaxID=47308 RepID=A0A8C6WZZ6_9GOBI